MTREIRRYCEIECDLLAKVMTAFRDTAVEAEIVPKAWRGAGWLSAELHRQHGTPKRPGEDRPADFEAMAHRAYYGGRFEITRVGAVPGPVHGHDLNSAYPAAMALLPCPLHTTWRLAPHCTMQPGAIYLADISYRHGRGVSRETFPLAGLPHRARGRLRWPLAGRGVYWSPEIEAAKRLGMSVAAWHGGYVAERRCDCRPYEWVPDLYELRRSLGASTRGHPLKLGLNGAYGKLAQRVGSATYRDIAAAGLITAIVRGWLNDAAALDPEAIVMLATDAIYSTRPLALDIGQALGQWEAKTYDPGIFIVQPGVYWPIGAGAGAAIPRTRGIPIGPLLERTGEFEAAWADFIAETEGADASALSMIAGPPAIFVPVNSFAGLRLGLHRRDPYAAGKWTGDKDGRTIRFSWFSKRRFDRWRIDGGQVVTYPYLGAIGSVSEDYMPSSLTAEHRLLNEAAPDYPQWSAIDAILGEFK